MIIDKPTLKRRIDGCKPHEILVLTVNKLEKDSLKLGQKQIEKFIKKGQDYLIIAIKK